MDVRDSARKCHQGDACAHRDGAPRPRTDDVTRRQDSDNSLTETRRSRGHERQRTERLEAESGERGETRGVCLGGSGDCDGYLVAPDLALEVELTFQPPGRGMPTNNRPDQELKQ